MRLDGAGPAASAQAAEQVALHAAAAVTEDLDHPRVSVALQRTAVPCPPAFAFVAVPNPSQSHAAARSARSTFGIENGSVRTKAGKAVRRCRTRGSGSKSCGRGRAR